MKAKYLFLVLLLYFAKMANAQIPMGTWKFHVASAKAIDIVSDGERIFTALENGLYIYNPYTEEGVLKTALNGSDNEAIKAATEKLMTASQAFSQKLYEAAARDTNAAGTSASGQGAGNDDDIVDAEIVDEK
jgi:hypothetical protein